MFTELSLPGARTYHRQNLLYEKLKMKEKEVMSFLHNLEMEYVEACKNNQELKKEINLYHKKLVILKQESKKLQADWAIIHQYLVDLNLSCKDEQEKTSNLETQEHQVSETARELGLATAQEESILQNKLSPQEFPAPSPASQSSLDEFSSI
ncbi:disks large homolog 5-like isoform X2 [Mus musculus]|uniref:disks large homolog 5-like isoform X2 n=1 Tax=Mus musculus TaxID=10090 RepID=UPI0005ABA084|nr:disks large homolog 5-like isoform X2 [Mus musculus]|eukprot:XP_017171719.1 PREDICTED: disks large homolog 5-like isoform X2 [Mus musculus]